jgi:hypothetical protein
MCETPELAEKPIVAFRHCVARMSKVDDIVMQLHDKTSFLAGVQALKKNLTGPPSAIFGVAEVWPAFVTLSTYIVSERAPLFVSPDASRPR